MPPPGGIRTSLSFKLQGGGPVSTYMMDRAFQPSNALYSPGTPLSPVEPQPIRAYQFEPGTNLNFTPRAYDPIGFPQLRAFANVELVRLAIETRKDQVERMDWSIKVRDARNKRLDSDERIRRMTRFWSKPDGETDFASWLRESMEDLLALDAPAFEKRRNRGGKLIGLDIVSGDSIKLLIDQTGRRPHAPIPAYQQIMYGRPWINLTTNDLLYIPRNKRPHKMYGYGPVEQVIVTIHTALQRQTSQLFHFGLGNVPAGIITGPEGWSPDQLQAYQDWFDARLSGNLGEKQKVIWAPFGSKYQAFKEAPLKDEFDEWLARVICYCFSLPPTAFIKSMNRATAEAADSTALEEGREPFLRWWKRAADNIMADELDCPDLEWSWGVADDIDPLTQAQIDDVRLRNGSLNVNEVRDRYGEPPVEGGDENRIYLATGAVSLVGNQEAEDTRQDTAETQLDILQHPPPAAAPAKKPTAKPAGSKPAAAKPVQYATGQSRGASAGTGRPKKSMAGRSKEPGKT
jgi:hypothetical protein